MAQPEEWAAVTGLAPPIEFDGVVRDGRAEVGPPLGFAVIAVGARVGQDVHAAVADLYRQGVGMSVRGDAEKPVRTAVEAAPNLRRLLPARAKHGRSGVG